MKNNLIVVGCTLACVAIAKPALRFVCCFGSGVLDEISNVCYGLVMDLIGAVKYDND